MLQKTRITDLGPLRGRPLKDLRLEGCKLLKDLSPLAGYQDLEELTVPAQAQGLDSLRQLPKLKYLDYTGYRKTTAAEFWKAYDARRK